MTAKIFLNLLILYGVLCQGIVGTLSENDIDESSDLLVRQKRVINRAPGGDVREQIRSYPYVVSIRPYRTPRHCVGVILTNHIVLTVAKCVELDVTGYYRVYSGTPRTSGGRHVTHNVTDKRIFIGIHPHRPADGIALITVSPPFVFSSNTKNIEFYEGPIHPGTFATVSGWGCNAEGHPGTIHPDHLRSITVPIIGYQQCAALLENNFPISERDICTLDSTGDRYCGVHDVGAPLVVLVNRVPHLLGIHIRNGRVLDKSKPDVFINLQNAIYKTWLAESIRTIEADLHLHDNSENL